MKETDGEEREVLDIKQKSLKTLLVTCFGYMGYSAFIFSRVECKELINKISRDMMAKTKEIAEKYGMRVISGYVDCLFVQGELEKIKKFSEEISKTFGIDLNIDNYFRVIVFCSARNSRFESVVNRYFGLTNENEMEDR